MPSVQGSGDYVTPPPLNATVLLGTGQSNKWGAEAGLEYINPNILYWDTDVTHPNSQKSTFWHPLHGTGVHLPHGDDASCGKRLSDNGYDSGVNRLVILNVSLGSSAYTEWTPSRPEYNDVKNAIQAALTALIPLLPSSTIYRIRPYHNQGTTDMSVNSQTYQAAWNVDGYQIWSNNLRSDIIAPVMASSQYTVLNGIIVKSHAFTGSLFGQTVPISQLAASGYPGIQDNDYYIDADSLSYQTNGVHMNKQGYIDLGYLWADKVIFLDSNNK